MSTVRGFAIWLSALLYVSAAAGVEYHGYMIGSFGTTIHSVAGTIYAVDDTRLRIIGFSYDGTAPDAFIWGGETGSVPSTNGFIIPKEDGSMEKLGAYANADIEITLPPNIRVSDLAWISIWCRRHAANFGHVIVPSFTPPAEHDLGALGFSPRVHNVYASAVVILNPKQIRFENLDYDGIGPGAYFWVGPGGTPRNADGSSIPDENGSTGVISSYRDATFTLTLPDDVTVFDFGHIGLWCVLANQDFGHLDIPAMDQLNIPPLPLPMPTTTPTVATSPQAPPTSQSGFTNCETLIENVLQVSWMIEDTDIVIRLSSMSDVGQYTAFGVSGSTTRTQMVGADVIVAFIDTNGDAQAVDYYLASRAQCSPQNGAGACPDDIASASANDDATLVESSTENGVTHIVYRRPLAASDPTYDRAISTTGPTYVIWARGLINADGRVAYHNNQRSPGSANLRIDFGRVSSSCPPLGQPEVTMVTDTSNPTAATAAPDVWTIEGVTELENATFSVQMGLTGGQKGYNAITGSVGWGIAWWIDGLLIPELTLQRGRTYTFLVSGGDDQAVSGNYHPFYITDDPNGGYAQLVAAEQQNIAIYAGPEEGPLCQWAITQSTGDIDQYATFADFKAMLIVNCAPGEPGRLVWTVPMNAPDLLYYHCYTHRFLGWKIHLVSEDTDNSATTSQPNRMAFTNCETIIENQLEVSWMINGTDIIIRLSSTSDDQYTAFGVSGSSTSTQMVGADVVVAFIDANGDAQVADYYLGSRNPCSDDGTSGACPDSDISPLATDDVTLVESYVENGVAHVVYRRPLAARDSTYDKAISATEPTYVIWARGGVAGDGRVAYHLNQRSPGESNLQIDFSDMTSTTTCPGLGATGDMTTDDSDSSPPVITDNEGSSSTISASFMLMTSSLLMLAIAFC